MGDQSSLIIGKAIKKANEVHGALCAAIADLEATGKITKNSEGGKRLQDARSGLAVLQKILTGEVTSDPLFGLRKPPR